MHSSEAEEKGKTVMKRQNPELQSDAAVALTMMTVAAALTTAAAAAAAAGGAH